MPSNLPDIEQIRTLSQLGRSSDLFFVVETTELECSVKQVAEGRSKLHNIAQSREKNGKIRGAQRIEVTITFKV